jgi:catechol 2,3-dioxygenase-like lactoylglutathione lyase family enzyme
MATVSVRYIVDDVDAAIAFYTEHLGFGLELNPAPVSLSSREATCASC